MHIDAHASTRKHDNYIANPVSISADALGLFSEYRRNPSVGEAFANKLAISRFNYSYTHRVDCELVALFIALCAARLLIPREQTVFA